MVTTGLVVVSATLVPVVGCTTHALSTRHQFAAVLRGVTALLAVTTDKRLQRWAHRATAAIFRIVRPVFTLALTTVFAHFAVLLHA